MRLLCFVFSAEALRTKVPTPSQGKEFCNGTICKLDTLRDRRWRFIRCHVLAISPPKQAEWFFQAKQQTNMVYFALELRNINFCGSKSRYYTTCIHTYFIWSKKMAFVGWCGPALLICIFTSNKVKKTKYVQHTNSNKIVLINVNNNKNEVI